MYKLPTRDTEQKFLKEVYVVKFCKKCDVRYLIRRGKSQMGKIRYGMDYCIKHRHLFWQDKYLLYKYQFQWPSMKALQFKVWKKWVQQNPERRRQLARESYHRHKNNPRNKVRKHRATKKPLI